MRIRISTRRIELSAQEFATFRPGPGAGSGGAPWRAEAGRQWHESMRQFAQSEGKGWQFERAISCEIPTMGWTIAITGRTDQWLETSEVIRVREIKTVSIKLPRNPLTLATRFAHHFLQLATYCHAARFESGTRKVQGELIFIDPTEGTQQIVALPDSAEIDLLNQAQTLAAHAENRRASHARLLNLPDRIPFKTPRSEWLKCCTDLDQAGFDSAMRLLVAPTGFGKTSAALRHGLNLLRGGRAARLLYLTGKGTGQFQVLSELRRLAHSDELRAMVLRPRSEHEIEGITDDPEQIRINWALAKIDPSQLLIDATDLRKIRELGCIAGVPPWDITKAMLTHADVIICDYNYVFSPRNRTALESIPGWDMRDTVLIVDEAHNLPDRTAECLSLRDDAQSAADFAYTLTKIRAPETWCQTAQQWADLLHRLPKADVISADDRIDVISLAEQMAILTIENPFNSDDLSEASKQALWNSAAWSERLEVADLGWLLWSPRPGELSLDCLTAAKSTGERLSEFGHVLLMTATPGPPGSLAKDCGFDADSLVTVIALAPWRHGAYTVAIDARIDTRLRSRENHLFVTSSALIKLAHEGAVAAFFPSYKYAEAVVKEVQKIDPKADVALQPRGLGPDGTARFVEKSLHRYTILCLILGGSLGEGVDMLGGRVRSAVVIGPALPEVNALQEARRKMYIDAGWEDAFSLAYIRPGMRKVNQALGRLVRAPGHSARVLLHCRRFANEEYRCLLSSEYGDPQVLIDDEEFLKWTSQS